MGFDGGSYSSEYAAPRDLDLDDLVEPPSVDVLDFFLRACLEVDNSLVGDSNPPVLDFRLCLLGCLGTSDASPVAELLMDWRRLDFLGASDCSSFELSWFWWHLDGFGSSGKSLFRESLVPPEMQCEPEEICAAERQKNWTVTFENCRHRIKCSNWN